MHLRRKDGIRNIELNENKADSMEFTAVGEAQGLG